MSVFRTSRTTERLISSEDLSTRGLIEMEKKSRRIDYLKIHAAKYFKRPCYIELDSASHESSQIWAREMDPCEPVALKVHDCKHFLQHIQYPLSHTAVGWNMYRWRSFSSYWSHGFCP